jgi:hypothetical protein
MEEGEVYTVRHYAVAKVGTGLQCEPAQAFAHGNHPVCPAPNPAAQRREQRMSDL